MFEDVFEDEDEADILAWFETLEFGLGFVSLVTNFVVLANSNFSNHNHIKHEVRRSHRTLTTPLSHHKQR